MPDSKNKIPHPDRVRERKSGIAKTEAEENVSSLESNRAPSLLIIFHNKLFLFIFLGIIVVGLLMLNQVKSSPKNIAIQKTVAPSISQTNNLASSPASNPTSEDPSPRVRTVQFNSKYTPLSQDEILARAKSTVFFLKTPQGSGAGFLLSPDGIVVTQTRIIGRSDEAEVLIPSGIKKAVVLKRLTDPLDLAFLKVEKSDLEGETLYHSDICKEGEEIMVLGFPSGEESGEPILTTGIIRNCNSPYQGVRYFQVDRAVASENRGGPVINLKGEVIGIFKGKLALNGQEEVNVGLPIQMVRAVMEDKLVHLEERIKEREKFFKYIYDDFWILSSREYEQYQKNLTLLHAAGKLSAQDAYQLEKIPLNPPHGFSSLKAWIADLAERVLKEEITKDNAISLIKEHFDSSSLEKST